MKPRLPDYGLTGDFFIFAQAAILYWAFPEFVTSKIDELGEGLTILFDRTPAGAHTALGSLLAALAIVTVFFIGLLLDLGGSLVGLQSLIFNAHLRRNDQWVSGLFGRFSDYVQDDYAKIKAAWNAKSGKEARKKWSPKYLRRLESLLLAHALCSDGDSKAVWLDDQRRVCRIASAISIALFLLALELSVLALLEGAAGAWAPIGISYAALVIAAFVTASAYGRFCTTLFALAYMSVKAEAISSPHGSPK